MSLIKGCRTQHTAKENKTQQVSRQGPKEKRIIKYVENFLELYIDANSQNQ